MRGDSMNMLWKSLRDDAEYWFYTFSDEFDSIPYEPIPLMSEYVKLPFSKRRADMPGRFEGMSDAEWELVEDIFPNLSH